MAKLHHPDKSNRPDAQQHFKIISEAYRTLINDGQRNKYDEDMNNPFINNSFDWQNFFAAIQQGKIFEAKIVSSIKGAYDKQMVYEQMIQLRYTFKQIYQRVIKKIPINIYKYCPICHQVVKQKVPCVFCQGTGYVKSILHLGTLTNEYKSVCGQCNGLGTMQLNICNNCADIGYVKQTIQIEFIAPNSLISQQIVSIYKDDLNSILAKIVISKDDESYTNNNLDVLKQLEINIKDAILGCKKVINYLDDKQVQVDIPEGSTNETKIVIPDLGLKDETEKCGKLIISLSIIIPKGSLMGRFNKWLISKLKI